MRKEVGQVPDERRRGGREKGTDQWARWQCIATTARVVVAILQLLRDHITRGPDGLPF